MRVIVLLLSTPVGAMRDSRARRRRRRRAAAGESCRQTATASGFPLWEGEAVAAVMAVDVLRLQLFVAGSHVWCKSKLMILYSNIIY